MFVRNRHQCNYSVCIKDHPTPIPPTDSLMMNTDVWYHIMSYLPKRDLIHLGQTSRDLFCLACESNFWKDLDEENCLYLSFLIGAKAITKNMEIPGRLTLTVSVDKVEQMTIQRIPDKWTSSVFNCNARFETILILRLNTDVHGAELIEFLGRVANVLPNLELLELIAHAKCNNPVPENSDDDVYPGFLHYETHTPPIAKLNLPKTLKHLSIMQCEWVHSRFAVDTSNLESSNIQQLYLVGTEGVPTRNYKLPRTLHSAILTSGDWLDGSVLKQLKRTPIQELGLISYCEDDTQSYKRTQKVSGQLMKVKSIMRIAQYTVDSEGCIDVQRWYRHKFLTENRTEGFGGTILDLRDFFLDKDMEAIHFVDE